MEQQKDIEISDLRIKQATVRVVPNLKVCPMVATVAPSQDHIASSLSHALQNLFQSPHTYHRDTIVNYDGIAPVVNLVLQTNDERMTVKQLDQHAQTARSAAQHVLAPDGGRVHDIFWVSSCSSEFPPQKEPSAAARSASSQQQ
mmetsp:Transcript_7392/g.8927  ORF Transcript_7392/g.8927 Transcript_7392/m.8927 type:complete len:144 (+) Transcript_7392:47-478(+)